MSEPLPLIQPAPIRWGHITLLKRRIEPLYATGPGGEQYVADTHGYEFMDLRCDCGFEFSIEAKSFTGKSQLRNCQRPECTCVTKRVESTNPFGRVKQTRGVPQTFYLRPELRDKLIDYATTAHVTLSRALTELVEYALAHGIDPKVR
jgi:hypothetical protein